MKESISYVVLSVILLLSFTCCATTYMPLSQVPNAQILGSIAANFESRDKVGMGVLSYTGIGLAAAGGFFSGRGLSRDSSDEYRKGDLILGSALAGGALTLVLIEGLVNKRKSTRLNTAAREALLTAANEKYFEEDVDIRDIQFTHIRVLGGTHFYNASGTVIKK